MPPAMVSSEVGAEAVAGWFAGAEAVLLLLVSAAVVVVVAVFLAGAGIIHVRRRQDDA